MNFKKLLAVVVIAMSTWFSAEVVAQTYGANDCPTGCPATNFNYTWATTINPNTGGYLDTVSVGGSDYTVYAVYGTYNGLASTYLTSTPWYTGNSTLALQFTTAVNGQLGQAGGASPTNVGVLFAYAAPTYAALSGTTVPITFWYSETPLAAPGGSGSLGAPEIDGSLAPKVGFLLGCLFLMFGRKKQNSEPMLVSSAI